MISVAIVKEDGKMVRLFKDPKCIYSAYCWCHKNYCLSDFDPSLRLHQLPDWLKVEYYMLTQEQIDGLIK